MLQWATISQGFGCMSLSPGFFGSKGIDAMESEKTLRRALDLGITVLNTADFYGGLGNIELIGRFGYCHFTCSSDFAESPPLPPCLA